jgi:hypothetical protein
VKRIQRCIVRAGAAALALSGVVVAVTTAPASATITTNPKLVGTYDVTVQINPSFGGEVVSGQFVLKSDGTWTGNALNGFRGCSEKGAWLSSGNVLALSDVDPGQNCDQIGTADGLIWMVTVHKGRKLGSATAPGYVNAPYVFNGTWDAVPAPKTAPTPQGTSTYAPQSQFANTYNLSIVNASTTTMVVASDGTWAYNLPCDRGAWLAGDGLIALSDTLCLNLPHPGLLMAPTFAGPKLGTPRRPGYANYPYYTEYQWYASP